MADEVVLTTSTNNISPTLAKTKQRTNPTMAARSRARSPGTTEHDARPQKRARKAINCEPCRNSKLKCDRNRPCSSCVLRGTTASCYQDGGGNDPQSDIRAGRGPATQSVDAAQEFARIRQSLNTLEQKLFSSPLRISPPANAPAQEPTPVKSETASPSYTVPGMLASDDQGGLYAGPTSTASHLMLGEDRATEEGAENSDNGAPPLSLSEQDAELLSRLPSTDKIEEFIVEYFSYCNWIYRQLNERAFMRKWRLFKSGAAYDRVTLASICLIMAVALHYLPSAHPLLDGTGMSLSELSAEYHDIARIALRQHQLETRNYSMDLIESLLLRTHYLYLIKTEGEDVWHATGELVIYATAMGLHRDPGTWKMSQEVAERRRWAWWHILLLERWQCFMFGRPLIIASHHFDTSLPSYCDPAIDPTGRLYLPNIALFKLAYILGDIVDNALSLRPVGYDAIKASDQALADWLDALPSEIVLDEYGVARNLASTDVAIRRFGVQSVIIRTAFYHIRFTLHRPYASAANSKTSLAPRRHSADPVKCAQSLEIAVGAADKLITIVSQSRPDFLAHSCLAVPGHMNWGPFHCFSAAMFFAFQLIANPDQPGAGMFRASIDKALMTLNECRGRHVAIAEKACEILNCLSPLYSGDFQRESPEVREAARCQVMKTVRKLNLPYHDSHAHRRSSSESPSGRSDGLAMLHSPASTNSTSMSPLNIPGANPSTSPINHKPSYESFPGHHLLSGLTNTMNQPHSHSHSPSQAVTASGMYSHTTTPGAYDPPSSYSNIQYGNEALRYGGFIDDTANWGAQNVFGQGEWSQLLSVLQPTMMSPTRT